MPKLSPDEKWGRFNEKLEEAMKSNDFYLLGTIYYQMADFLAKEGKKNDDFRKLGYESKLHFQKSCLLNYVKSEVAKKVQVLSCGNPCEACRKISNKSYSINEALQNNPLPVKNCSCIYGCRCTYVSDIS